MKKFIKISILIVLIFLSYLNINNKAYASTKIVIEKHTFTYEKDWDYTGKEIKPKVKVKDANNKTLKENTDYTVSYNDNKHPGTGKIKVKLKKGTKASYTLKFNIHRFNFENNKTYTSWKIKKGKYKAEKKAVKIPLEYVKVKNSKNDSYRTLKKDKDYTVSYSYKSSNNMTKYYITIKGKGNYKGTINIVAGRALKNDKYISLAIGD